MSRNIGLLTLPLHHNYGGILQIVALYTFLSNHNFYPVFLNNRPARGIKGRLAELILPWIPYQNWHGVREAERKRQLHKTFIKQHMPSRTHSLRTSGDFGRFVSHSDIDTIIVGSDQVWRLQYHYDNEHMVYFLDFIEPKQSIKRVAYAASFGHERWVYPNYSEIAKSLLKKFDQLSVREESGKSICETEFGISDAEIVLDPTMIVDKSFYYDIIKDVHLNHDEFQLNYVLDRNEGTLNTLKTLQNQHSQMKVVTIGEHTANIDIPTWLAYFKNANFIVTDSFHGTIFSILFNKNFITIANDDRGIGRFKTILGRLGLLDRLIVDAPPSLIASKASETIDYESVNSRLEALKAHSSDFLINSLST